MSYHERQLPHCYPPGAILFLTWRLFGTWRLPTQNSPTLSAGKAFAESDLILDRATRGPKWLHEPRVAEIIVQALRKGEQQLGLYELFSWVIMPNHVHAVMKPLQPLPQAMRWLKGSTARAANLVLGRTGKPFWQYETYDHVVRSEEELNRIIRYIEKNPVRAGLCSSIEDWPWSSAAKSQAKTPTLHFSHTATPPALSPTQAPA